MLYIGKKPEPKHNVGKIVLTISAAIAGIAALAILAYKLYQKFVPGCIDCECEDFLDDEELFDEDCLEVECEEVDEEVPAEA
ncbi:MAG: hypothetical protein IJC81_03270 [Clostridia bacterium]|nr:hypothetical protein [Clostridia bacterium]